jgi:acetate kinase
MSDNPSAPETILTVNAGSSSIKFELFDIVAGAPQRRFRGELDGIGTHPHLSVRDQAGQPVVDRDYGPAQVPHVHAAQDLIGGWLDEHQPTPPRAVGHRVVHGGATFDRPVRIDDAVLAKLEALVPLAPLHQPNNLAPIRSIRKRRPDLPQIACFDTAFHHGHAPVVDRFAIPRSLYAEGVRRYGFHGLSYEYIASRLPEMAPEIAGKRVIVAHLGSGASLCALAAGRSIDTTMSFTALDGLAMATRPGQLDPGVVLYLMAQKRMDAAAIEHLLYNDCGLKGLSGISGDIRDLLASEDADARLAVDCFVHRIAQCTAALTASLRGLDGFVFTAGIGENAAAIRAAVCARLDWLGLGIDAGANAADGPRISPTGSRVGVYVVPTDEEFMIARHTLRALSAKS